MQTSHLRHKVSQSVIPSSLFVSKRWVMVLGANRMAVLKPCLFLESERDAARISSKGQSPALCEVLRLIELYEKARIRHPEVTIRQHRRPNEVFVTSALLQAQVDVVES